MIEIKSVDEQTAAARCKDLALLADDVYDMTDKGEILGTACVRQTGEEATILYFEAPQGAFTDALLRAVLNAAAAKGAKTARVEVESLRNHMLKKGYFADLSDREIKIDGFFAKSSCKG